MLPSPIVALLGPVQSINTLHQTAVWALAAASAKLQGCYWNPCCTGDCVPWPCQSFDTGSSGVIAVPETEPLSCSCPLLHVTSTLHLLGRDHMGHPVQDAASGSSLTMASCSPLQPTSSSHKYVCLYRLSLDCIVSHDRCAQKGEDA